MEHAARLVHRETTHCLVFEGKRSLITQRFSHRRRYAAGSGATRLILGMGRDDMADLGAAHGQN